MKALWHGNWQSKFNVDSQEVHVESIHNLQVSSNTMNVLRNLKFLRVMSLLVFYSFHKKMHSAIFTRILLNSKLLDAIEDIMKSSNILLHHTKAHFKPPSKGAPFPMHQDYHYFPYEKDSMVAVFIHLDDTTPENGGNTVCKMLNFKTFLISNLFVKNYSEFC